MNCSSRVDMVLFVVFVSWPESCLFRVPHHFRMAADSSMIPPRFVYCLTRHCRFLNLIASAAHDVKSNDLSNEAFKGFGDT